MSDKMDFSGSNFSFSMGTDTDKKMNMSLDDIIKSNKKVNKRDQHRKGGKATTMRNDASKGKRNKELVKSVTKRASAARSEKINQARGLVSKPSPRVKIAKTTTRFAVRSRKGQRAVPTVSDWAAQQRQRRVQQTKKANQYKAAAASPLFGQKTSRDRESKPNRRSIITRVPGKNTSVNAARSRGSGQSNRRVVNDRRGVQASPGKATLNARFGGIGKTTKQIGRRSFVTTNGGQQQQGGRQQGRQQQQGGRQQGGRQVVVKQGGRGGRQQGGRQQGGRQGGRQQQDTQFRIRI